MICEKNFIKLWLEFLNTKILELLDTRVSPRNYKSLTRGLIAGIINLYGFMYLIYFILLFNEDSIPADVSTYTFLISWNIITAFSCVLSGYIAGNTKLGFIDGNLFFLIMTLMVVLLIPLFAIRYLYVSILILFICCTMGFMGGYFGDRRKLYPFNS